VRQAKCRLADVQEHGLKLLNMSDEIRAFIVENEARLKAKD
jgi:hypothetical protein